MAASDLSHVTPVWQLHNHSNGGSGGQCSWNHRHGSLVFIRSSNKSDRPRCIQLVPQIIKNYRRHGTDGLSAVMMFSWAIAGVPFGIYTIAQSLNIPLQIQPNLFVILALICCAQCMYYDRDWSLKKCIWAVTATSVIFGGIEAGIILGIRVICSN